MLIFMHFYSPTLVLGVLFLFFWNRGGNGGGDPEAEFAPRRDLMVRTQIAARGVRDARVLVAMTKVPRHEFVPTQMQAFSYDDGPVVIGEGQTISQPYIVAFMTEQAGVNPESKVLEVGTGSGYQTAVLAEIASQVFSVEIVPLLQARAIEVLSRMGYNNIHFRLGDGYEGWPEEAPFDAILVTAAPDHVPLELVSQLKIGGRMVIPIGDYSQDLELITRTETGHARQSVLPVRFVPMTGKGKKN
ncbi:MAG TPA: protein-L-isoaspartate(D-aspartate) O-methyltransferase [Acidobacteriota bacterium]|nr:protein-L-isoaspartate(D-aspartate) O-methyltransferase [Acidobacteriota bacterium]